MKPRQSRFGNLLLRLIPVPAIAICLIMLALWGMGPDDVRAQGDPPPPVVISTTTTWTNTQISLHTLIITNNATLNLTGTTVLTAENIIINEGAIISADGQGYAGTVTSTYTGQGPGGGQGSSIGGGSGGGHGSLGGSAPLAGAGGAAYGSVTEPTEFGSAGGRGSVGTPGDGGGAIRLIVTDTLLISGTLSANGTDASGLASNHSSGGGSGGSIWIEVGTLAGIGTIQANGGQGAYRATNEQGGGGAGGRIAVYYGNSSFALDGASLQVYGGDSTYQAGGLGSVYLYQTGSSNNGTFLVDEDTSDSEAARLYGADGGSMTFDQVVVEDNSTLILVPFNDGDITYTDDSPFVLYANDITIGTGARLSADGQGYAGTITTTQTGSGPGGGSGSLGASGGGHGSVGGDGYRLSGGSTIAGGAAYGSVTEPTEFGSAGGRGSVGTPGDGGGAIRLIVTDTLLISGTLSANGTDASGAPSGGHSSGGGAGGSIWVTAQTVAGDGMIQANGGQGAYRDVNEQGGGGGGGRIALYYGTFSQTLTTEALGGTGYASGGQGSVYLSSSQIDSTTSTVDIAPAQVVANGIATATITVTLKNENGHGLADRPVAVGLESGEPVYLDDQLLDNETLDLGLTDENGIVTGQLTTTVAGSRVFFAQSEAEIIQDQGALDFVPGSVDVNRSNIEPTNGIIVPADGVSTINLRVTALDAFSNTIQNATVVLTSTFPISLPQPATTNASGQVLVDVKSNYVGLATIEALIDDVLISDTVNVTFQGPDLSISKSGPAEVTLGYPLTYTLNFENEGPLTATNVVISDTFPLDAVDLITQTSAYTFSQDGDNLTWEVGDLAPAETGSFALTGTVYLTAPTVITNRVSISTTDVELDTGDNQALRTTTVLEPDPNLVVPTGVQRLNTLQGQVGTLTATLTNNGTAPVADLTISPPPFLNWVSLTPTIISELGVDQSQVFTITAATSGLDIGLYRDVITLTSSNEMTKNIQLEVYVHPELVNLTVPVKNDLEDDLADALVNLKKTLSSIRVTEGYTDSYTPQFSDQTDSSGQALLSDVEVGVYTYTVAADGHSTVTGLITVTSGMTQLIPPPLTALPSIVFEPSQLQIGVQAGGTLNRNVFIRNNGPGAATNFQVYTPVDLTWISSGWPISMPTLAAGETLSLTLFLTPPANEPTITYQRYITVTADGVEGSAVLAASIEVTTSNVADLAFQVEELGTTTPLSGASISLVNQSGRVVNGPGGNTVVYDSYVITTDSNGEALFTDLPLAKYRYEVKADSYYGATGEVEVLPVSGSGGQQGSLSRPASGLAAPLNLTPARQGSGSNGNSVNVLLEPDPFTYNWTVEETSIVDTYAITVEISVEATVPTPRLFVSPLVFCPGETGLSYLIANMGPVTMTNVTLSPSHEGVSFSGSIANGIILAPGEAYNGSLNTSGNASQAALSGQLLVTAQYAGELQTVDYQTSSRSVKLCLSGGGSGGAWDWEWDGGEGKPRGHYTGTRPTFPGNSTPPAPADPASPERAKLTLSGEATLERQAFLATLELNSVSASTVEDIQVDIGVKNEAGAYVVGGFVAVPPVPTDLGDLLPGQKLNSQWTLIPGELGITDPAGQEFLVQAQIVYTYLGVVYTTTTLPAPITVLPQPRVRLTYTHNQPDDDNIFYLEVKAENEGYGIARNLILDLSQVDVLADLDGNGRSLIFDLKQTTLDGATQPTAYILNFGDIDPDEVKTGRWRIQVKAGDGLPLIDPWITGFKVHCDHLPYQGQVLSDLLFCGEINQLFLNGECPFCGIGEKNLRKGGPINTANGNYSYSQNTPAIQTVGDPLQLTWTYNSLTSGAFPDIDPVTTTLGVGWTHNYDLRLTPDETPTGDFLVFKAFHGTPLKFEVVKGAYRPAPGIHGTLTRTEVLTGQFVYTLTAANQAVYIFDTDGRLTTQSDPQGNVTNFTYNGSDQLTQVSEPVSGRFLNFTYDGSGRLATITDPLSRTTQFGYDGQDRLTVVTDTRQFAWQYEYTQLSGGQSILSHIVDPDSRTVEQTAFDDLGRAISQTYRGESLTIDYFDHGRRLVSDALGRETIHIYDNQLLLVGTVDPLSQTETFVLDEAFNRTYSKDENGNPTFYARTPLGYTTAVTDALGNVTTYTYDQNNNLIQSIDARQNQTYHLYDGQNNLISRTNALDESTFYTYNSAGQMTSVTDPKGYITRYGYDLLGNRTVMTDALGNATRYEYDAAGRLIKTIDPLGKVTQNEYDGDDKLIRTIENVHPTITTQNYLNEYNLITEYAYDGAGRRTLITDTLGRVSRNEYDDVGRLSRTVQNVHPSISTQNYQNEYNLVTGYGYDELSNLVVVTDTLGRVDRTEYDERNRTERTITNYVDGIYNPSNPDEDIITQFAYDAAGNLISIFDVLDRETRTEYDELNRVARTIVNYQNGVYLASQPDEDLITAYTYDAVGNQQTMTDPLGRAMTYAYDALNRVVTMTNALSGTMVSTYDPNSNRLTITDAEGRITAFGYDPLNRVVTTTDALSGQTLVTYDEVGNRTAMIDANGNSTTFNYNSLYRLIAVTDAESQTTTLTYDALGNRLSMTDAEDNATTFSYDSLNRLNQTTNALSGTMTVTYDALSNRLSTTDANSHTTTYLYDDLNRTVQVTDPNSLTTEITYDGLSNRLSMTNGANETTEFEYDTVNRLILTRDPLDNETVYRYDGAGNRTAMIDAEGVETRYQYDDLNRLTAVIANYEDGTFDAGQPDQDVKTSYTYDQVGNRLSVIDANANATTYTYDALNRRLTGHNPLSDTMTYGYDPVGNQTVMTNANGVVTTFDYDNVNRLIGIDYSDSTPDVSFTYDNVGNRLTMLDGTGVTTYTYDALYRLTETLNGADQAVGYGYDPVGNRTNLIYPDGRVVTYTYDLGNRLDTVTDWYNGQYAYDYDQANRLTDLNLPNGVASAYSYDEAGRLTLLTHNTLTDTLASYAYSLDRVGNRTLLTETLLIPNGIISGTYVETAGLVAIEAENAAQVLTSTTHAWQVRSTQNGYTGTGYLQALPDLDALQQTAEITTGPTLTFLIDFTTPGTYTLWVRGSATNAAGDSLYIGLGEQSVTVTGFAPDTWDWQARTTTGLTATLTVPGEGVYTLTVRMREDGLRLDRLLLTTDTTYLPVDFGPAETARQSNSFTDTLVTLARTIDYDYDPLYRLTQADYTSGELYQYSYDPVGNRLQQIINGDTTSYTYDAANRLDTVDDIGYTYDDNGNLLTTEALTNTWDAANRLIETTRAGTVLQPIYDGLGNRVGQTAGLTTTNFALDIQGLPEVIYTSEGSAYLHIPGVILAESGSGELRYLLADGLGSVRQAVDEVGQVVTYHEFDPYGNPVQNGGDPYGYTGEWWEDEVGLLYLRARWYLPETGTFLSRDFLEEEPPYNYVRGNPVNQVDPSGQSPLDPCKYCDFEANGYAEGYAAYGGAGFVAPVTAGREVVYNFATMERASYFYKTEPFWGTWNDYFDQMVNPTLSDDHQLFLIGLTTAVLEIGLSADFVQLHHFDSPKTLDAEYSGRFNGWMIGGNTPVIQVGLGYLRVWSDQVTGDGLYYVLGAGVDAPVVVSSALFATDYESSGGHQWYTTTGDHDGYVYEKQMEAMKKDIVSGNYLPFPFNLPPLWSVTHLLGYSERIRAASVLKNTWSEHKDYFEKYFPECRSLVAN